MTDSDRDRRRETDEPDGAVGATAERPKVVAAAVSAVIFVGSVIPVPTATSGGSAGGAVGEIVGALPAEVGLTAPFHFFGYAVLAALIVRPAESVPKESRARRVVAIAGAATAATAFGFGIELVQAPIPWRSFAWRDAGLNAVGAVVGAVVGASVGASASAMTTRLYAFARSLR